MTTPTHLYRWDTRQCAVLVAEVTGTTPAGRLSVTPCDATCGADSVKAFGGGSWWASYDPTVTLYPSEVAALEAREAELRAWAEEHAAVVHALHRVHFGMVRARHLQTMCDLPRSPLAKDEP